MSLPTRLRHSPSPLAVFPGAVRIGGQYGNENIDPSMAQDLQIWNRMVQAGNANRDEFQGPVANIFGNAFTIPALFAAGAMGANAAGQLGVGGTAAAPGAAGPAATAGPAASAATPAAGGGGLLSAIGGGLKTGLPLAAAGMGLIGAVGAPRKAAPVLVVRAHRPPPRDRGA